MSHIAFRKAHAFGWAGLVVLCIWLTGDWANDRPEDLLGDGTRDPLLSKEHRCVKLGVHRRWSVREIS